MQKSASAVDCVIVGGGIGGAVLALSLGRKGHRIVILEREKQPLPTVRPEILAQATIEVFDRLGVGNKIRAEAVLPLHGLQLRRAGDGCLLEFSADEFREAGVQLYSTDPALTRRILLEEAQAHVELRRGVEVQQLLHEGNRVIGVSGTDAGQPFELRARMVVGDDGTHSRIRKGLGILLSLKEFPLDFLVAAGPAVGWEKMNGPKAWMNASGIRNDLFAGLFVPIPGARVAMVFGLTPKTYQRLQAQGNQNFHELATRLAPEAKAVLQPHAFPKGFAHIQRPFGHAPRYVSNGAALLGDAAHPVTPVGGQGANMSVADAMALAEVAHDALSAKNCSAERLSHYEKRRRVANDRSLRFSTRATRVLGLLALFPWAGAGLELFIRRVDRFQKTKVRFMRSGSSAFRSPDS